jgi:hypothetical protein
MLLHFAAAGSPLAKNPLQSACQQVPASKPALGQSSTLRP